MEPDQVGNFRRFVPARENHGVTVTHGYDIADAHVALPEGLELAEPIAGHVRLTRTNRGILADARLTTQLAGECARCLRPLSTPIDVVLEEDFDDVGGTAEVRGTLELDHVRDVAGDLPLRRAGRPSGPRRGRRR